MFNPSYTSIPRLCLFLFLSIRFCLFQVKSCAAEGGSAQFLSIAQSGSKYCFS